MQMLMPDAKLLQTKGYASLAYIPFLIGKAGTYLDEPNRYLRERALREWPPSRFNATGYETYPTIQTLATIASRLKNFLEWCEANNTHWKNVTYVEHIATSYKAQMRTGVWSVSRAPLAPRTIASRIREALLFLMWAHERGLRSAVHVRDMPSTNHIGHGAGKSDRNRRSTLNPIRTPKPPEVERWLHEVEILRGPVKRLCCELIIRTGIRIEECVQWRTDTLAIDPRDWDVIDDLVQVRISRGCKGHKDFPASTLGPERWISLPVDLAIRIHEYRSFERPAQHLRWVRSAKDKEERDRRRKQRWPSRLFLGEKSNQPFSARNLRRAWTNIPSCPEKWHPHLGRHYYAVETIVGATRQRMRGLNRSENPSIQWLAGEMSDTVKLLLRPVMGHLSEQTTYQYLRAARVRLLDELGHPSQGWQTYLDSDEGSGPHGI